VVKRDRKLASTQLVELQRHSEGFCLADMRSGDKKVNLPMSLLTLKNSRKRIFSRRFQSTRAVWPYDLRAYSCLHAHICYDTTSF